MITAKNLLVASVLLLPLPACAQSNSSGVPRGGVPPSYEQPKTQFPRVDDDDAFTLDPLLEHRQQQARKVERKKRMVDTAKRLLALTEQLQHDLKGREATPEDAKRLDEIARLARLVKDQMRQ